MDLPYRSSAAVQSRNFSARLAMGGRFKYASNQIDNERGTGDMPKARLNDIDIYYEEHGQGRPMAFL